MRLTVSFQTHGPSHPLVRLHAHPLPHAPHLFPLLPFPLSPLSSSRASTQADPWWWLPGDRPALGGAAAGQPRLRGPPPLPLSSLHFPHRCPRGPGRPRRGLPPPLRASPALSSPSAASRAGHGRCAWSFCRSASRGNSTTQQPSSRW